MNGIKNKLLCVSVFVISSELCGFAQTSRSIAPSGLGLETRDGNTGDDVLQFTNERSQLFQPSVLPWTDPVAISGISFRVNEGSSAASVIIPRVEIRISTSSKTAQTMSNIYANNVGADELVVFAQNDVVLSSPGGTGPNPFDLTFAFSQNFSYNPATGSLLFRLITSGGAFSGGRLIDSEQGGSGYAMAAPGIFSTPVAQAMVTQFSWIPIPEPGPLLLIGSSATVLAFFFLCRRLST